MPRTETITCDHCGKDLAQSSNVPDYRIAVLNQRIPSAGGVVTDMPLTPELPHDHYFCGWKCLRAWMEQQRE